MFINSSKMMFLVILMVGSLIAISSNSWLGAWMGLEINLLSFIPLMKDGNNLLSSEASLKYFLTQAMASSIFLFSSIMLMSKVNFWESSSINNSIILSSLFMKTGIAPFHFWFPSVMEGLNWVNSLFLMTWQKIAPLMLISYISVKMLIIYAAITSSIIGALGGLNQTSLRKLLAFSSVNHLSWMMMSMLFNETLWMTYFLIYSLISTTIILYFYEFKVFYINQLFMSFMNSKISKIYFSFNLLSLGGLPPLLGFFPKWIVIQNLIIYSHLLNSMIFIFMSLITLYFYIRLCFSTFLLNYFEINWMDQLFLNKTIFTNYSLLSSLSLMGLPVISLLYYML